MIVLNAPVRKYSPMRIASARDRIVAITRAIREVMSVTTTNAREWKESVTGSHSEPVRNRKPLATIAGREVMVREKKIAMSRTLTAIPPRTSRVRNAVSDERSLCIQTLLQDRRPIVGYRLQDGFRLVDDALGKLGVRQRFRVLLRVVHHPPEHLHHAVDFCLRPVVVILLLVDNDPGERRDRVP